MLASEMIKKLLDLIVKHGDYPVCHGANEEDIETIETHPEFKKSDDYIDPESVKIFLID